MAQRGFSIRIFFPSGDPDGIRTVEKANWTGQILVFPRALFSEACQRDDVNRTGAYILWGPSDTSQLLRVYVGEGDPVLPRLEDHQRKKDFWTHAAVLTSKDQALNKASVQYLESRLVHLAMDVKRAELDNGNTPREPSLSEADRADVESFLNDLLLCLPVVGIPMFEPIQAQAASEIVLYCKNRTITARGSDRSEGFVVFAGSRARLGEAKSLPSKIKELRANLVERHVLELDGQSYVFTKEYPFSSPSLAAGVVLGNSSNGRHVWKDEHGRTLNDLAAAMAPLS